MTEDQVRAARAKIERDRVREVVMTLPTQSKLVLYSVLLLEEQGIKNVTTGAVYGMYKQLCPLVDLDFLTHRRIADLIAELDMLGIIHTVVVSKGRYGRTKEISLSIPLAKLKAMMRMMPPLSMNESLSAAKNPFQVSSLYTKAPITMA